VTQQSGIPVGQVFNLSSSAAQVESLPRESLWPKPVATRCDFGEQVEAASLLLARGELGESAKQFRALLQIGLMSRDAELTEAACHNLAAVYRQSKQWDTAEIWQQQSLTRRMRHSSESLQQSADELGRLACDLTGCGCDAFLKQDWELAESLWRRALAIEEWRGSWEGQATDSGNLGLLAAAQGRLDDGIRWLKQSLRLHRLMLDACGEGTDWMNLAELRRLQGKLPRAIRSLRQAIECFRHAEASPLCELAERRLREVQRIVALEALDPQLN
jgi:tetratricopeptide (TPR) repeat protein